MDRVHTLLSTLKCQDIDHFFTNFGTEYVTGISEDRKLMISMNRGGYIFTVDGQYVLVTSDHSEVLIVVEKIVNREPYTVTEFTKMIEQRVKNCNSQVNS